MIRSGRLFALIGASRSGKTQKAKAEISGNDRVLIWDIKGEYPVKYRARNKSQLIKLLKTLKGKPGIIGYTSDRLGDFSFFCKAAQSWVKAHFLAGHNSALIFEETADVTSPGKAPDEYGVILRRFLSYGVDIFAITQRPAESDKTAVGNASLVHICRLQIDRDRKSAAGDSGVPLKVIQGLRADQERAVFDYVTVDTGRGFYRKGVLTFKRNKPIFTDEKGEFPL